MINLSQLSFRHLFAAFLIATCALSTSASAQNGLKAVVTTEQVRAELMAHAPQGADPGKTVWVGLQLTHQPQWHTYWKNSGDSGLPTTLVWTLPPGVMAGDIAWPLPQKLPIGNLANYGYEGTVLLAVPLTITSDFKPSVMHSDIEVKLKANWLVCRKECIPEEGEFALRLPIGSSTALHGAAFEASSQAQPKALGGDSQIEIVGKILKVSVAGLPATLQGQTLEFFPGNARGDRAGRPSGRRAGMARCMDRTPSPCRTHRSQSPGGDCRWCWPGASRQRPALRPYSVAGQGNRATGPKQALPLEGKRQPSAGCRATSPPVGHGKRPLPHRLRPADSLAGSLLASPCWAPC
jgi:DsbC/DsbD-like thiol-disulfide interchange protein